MTPEQVAHVRATLSTDWDFPVRRVVTKANVKTLLDAIESAWAERDTLRTTLSRVEAERDGLRAELDTLRAGPPPDENTPWVRVEAPFGSRRVRAYCQNGVWEMEEGEPWKLVAAFPITITEGEKP